MAEILRNRDGFHAGIGRAWPILFCVVQMFAAPSAESRVEAAMHREIVLGDLKGAMEQCRSILADAGVSPPAGAKALFRLGQCLEKTGRRAEAYETYNRIINRYGDEAAAEAARARLAKWDDSIPGPVNLRFEEGTVGKLPAGWFVPALPRDADHWAQVHRGSGCRVGSANCAVVTVPDNAPIQVSDLMQSFSAKAYRGKTVRLRAWLRVEQGAPDDRAQMWLSVDRANGRKGSFDNMSDRPVRSAAWTMEEITSAVDDDATFVKFGVMSIGRGRVWVDGVSFEVIPAFP